MSDFQFMPLWGEPPKPTRGGGKQHQTALAIKAFMALLETAPGRWAELSSVDDDNAHPPSRATYIKKNYPNAEVETRATDNKNRRRIWVRIMAPIPNVIESNGDRQQAMRERAAEAATNG